MQTHNITTRSARLVCAILIKFISMNKHLIAQLLNHGECLYQHVFFNVHIQKKDAQVTEVDLN